VRAFHHQTVKASRKRRKCEWCGEMIEIGQPYVSYMWAAYGDSARITMHPECQKAAEELAAKEGGWIEWDLGEFRRGSTEQRRYICERCGDSGVQPAGCWTGKAYDSIAGRCELCAEL
jgi:ribosomal protein S27AE